MMMISPCGRKRNHFNLCSVVESLKEKRNLKSMFFAITASVVVTHCYIRIHTRYLPYSYVNALLQQTCYFFHNFFQNLAELHSLRSNSRKRVD